MKRRGLAFGGTLAVLCLLGVTVGLTIPVVAAQAATAQIETTAESEKTRVFRAGDTLEKLIRSAGIDKVEAARVAKALGRAFDVRDLKPGHTLSLSVGTGEDGQATLISATLGLDKGRAIVVTRDSKGLFVARNGTMTASNPAQEPERLAAKVPATEKAGLKAEKASKIAVKAPKPRARPASFASSEDHAAPADSPAALASTTPGAGEPKAEPGNDKPVPAAQSLPAPAPTGAELVKIKSGDTLALVLARRGVAKSEANRAIEAMRAVIDLRSLQIGQEVAVGTGPHGNGLERLAVRRRDGSFAEIVRRDDGGFGPPDSMAASAAEPAKAKAEAAVEPQSVRKPEPSIKAKDALLAADDAAGAARAAKAPIPPAKPRVANKAEKAEPKPDPATDPLTTLVDASEEDDELQVQPAKAMAPAAKAAATPGMREEQVTLAKGGTLHSLLKARGYQGSEVVAAARALALAVNPTTLRWGQAFKLAYAEDKGGSKRLERLALVSPSGKAVVIGRQRDGSYAPIDDRRSPSADEEAALARVEADNDNDLGIEEDAAGNDSAVYIEEQAAPRDTAYRLAVEPGDSLMNMLLREGVGAEEIDSAVLALRKVYNPRRLREGQTLALLIDNDSAGELHLVALSVPAGEHRVMEVQRQRDGSFEASQRRAPSFVDRLPPEGVVASVGGVPRSAIGSPGLAGLSAGNRNTASSGGGAANDGSDDEENGGWSVMSWLGNIGDAIGRTGEAEAAIADFAPEPKLNRALDLEERPDAIAPDELVPAEEDLYREVELAKGETITAALGRAGVNDGEAQAALTALKQVHSPKRLQAGQKIAVAFEAMQIPGVSEPEQTAAAPGENAVQLERISISISPDRDVVVERGKGDTFRAREIERPLIRAVYKASGEIRSSFYESALAAGLSMDILTQMVRMFSYDVDFQRSLRDGDSFEVLYERTENDRGDSVEQATVLFAALNVSGERIELFRYEPPSGAADYYDRAGQSVKKALLRTPIDGARISSGFGLRRHPIMGFTKKHKGVDFAAPPGTPVFAGGEGVVEKIGWFSSYGKYIRIKHSETFKTAYAHLRGYARGMKVGTKVRQGQVIGYVGSTGRSTGPHLHYEVLKHDVQINPNDSKLPIGKQLEGRQLAQFKAEIKSYEVMYAQAEARTQVARKDTNGK